MMSRGLDSKQGKVVHIWTDSSCSIDKSRSIGALDCSPAALRKLPYFCKNLHSSTPPVPRLLPLFLFFPLPIAQRCRPFACNCLGSRLEAAGTCLTDWLEAPFVLLCPAQERGAPVAHSHLLLPFSLRHVSLGKPIIFSIFYLARCIMV
jgi:hypothetical protein